MMIARPTAASAAATVITKKTNTCPAAPYTCAKATKVRFTALSISSTHMKMMIAFRRVSTPTTPMVKSTAEKKSASASIGTPLLADHHRPDDRGEQEHARDLEGEQIGREERGGHRPDGAVRQHRVCRGIARPRQLGNAVRAGENEDLGEHRDADEGGDEPPLLVADV